MIPRDHVFTAGQRFEKRGVYGEPDIIELVALAPLPRGRATFTPRWLAQRMVDGAISTGWYGRTRIQEHTLRRGWELVT